MKTAAIKWGLLFCGLWAAAARADSRGAVATLPATMPASGIQLMANGSKDSFWIAQVETRLRGRTKFQRSIVKVRSIQGGDWEDYRDLAGAVVDMTHQRGDLIVLLDDGEWRRLPQNTGNVALPGHHRILALAADDQALWCIGSAAAMRPHLALPVNTDGDEEEPTEEPATQPATEPSPEPWLETGPATTMAGGPPHLWALGPGASQWSDLGPLPEVAAGTNVALSLAVLDQDPCIAVASRGTVYTYRLAGETTDAPFWQDCGQVVPDPATATGPVKLLATPRHLALWVGSRSGGWLWQHEKSWLAPKPVAVPETDLPISSATVAVAGDEIRLLVLHNGRIYEQSCDFSLALTKQLTELPITTGSREPLLGRVAQWVTAAILVLVILASLLRQRTAVDIDALLGRVELASTGARIGAGVVDMLPIIGGFVWLAVRYGNINNNEEMVTHVLMVMLPMAGLYIAHTLVSELLWGRTLGKLIFGLRIVDYEGKRPAALPIILRNLLRIVDVYLLMLPLVVILFSPLRQRIGDAVSGTVVVSTRPPGHEQQS